ncbi:MAG: MMPL family transporter, partial [Deltaproteobacteria bacterium]|nr:MMPL family transporter [Deltaproteobacteria bacterium]
FVGVLMAALSMPLVADLGLNSDFEALLPEDKPSVIDLDRIRDRVGGFNTLTVAIESKDVGAMQRFANDLVPRLQKLPPDLVHFVDWNISAYEDFVWDHRHLYASLEELEQARDDLDERLDYERIKSNPFYVQLDDYEPPDPREVLEQIRDKAEEGKKEMEKYPGGYYVHPDRDLLALFIRSDLGAGNAAGIKRLISSIEAEVQALDPPKYAPDLTVEYAGNLVVSGEEHQALKNDLVVAMVLTILLVLLAIFVFFRSWRAPLILGGALSVPVIVTFGFAELAVDYLNTSTAFLGSIVIGNGINPSIIWLARYFEERRRGQEVPDALFRTHRGVWLATLTASFAAAIAYGSLMITDFRGFHDFGVIGAVGMILCWIGATVLLPAIAVLNERVSPLVRKSDKPSRNFYGSLFAWLAFLNPRAILGMSAVLSIVSVGLIGWSIASDPFEYDFRNLKSVREGSTRARLINDRAGEIASGSKRGDGIAVVVDRVEDAVRLRKELEHRGADENAPWGDVYSIQSLLPDDQEEKIPVLADIRKLLLDCRQYVDDEALEEIDEHIPPETIKPLTYSDVPVEVASLFTEKDDTRGRILVVSQREGFSTWDGRYLIRWSEELRALRTESGERPALAGRAPVFADMISAIWTDGPKAILASFTATLLLVLLAFRDLRQRLFTMVALLLGIAWMAGTMALAGMKLNFLNFIAFPITFGNGADYGVNVMRRYASEDTLPNEERVRTAVGETGGAVVLCSLTTIIGYLTLFTSANLALNSFGAAMAISEVTCLLAAVVTMPTLLLRFGPRRNRLADGAVSV